ncbi:MAG: ribonuclease III family protein, partial [Cyanobium sp.]
AMTPERRSQLLSFLERLGLDPAVGCGEGSALCRHRLELVEEALCHTSAALPRNHERLEFLGDAVLRLAAASFLQRDHRRLSVGQCSSLRAQLVSDRWLSELAERLELETVLRIGAVAAGDRAGRATVLAECCEALVGAVYEGWGDMDGGLGAVHRWLDPHWRTGSAELLADPLRHNWKSALQEWSQGQRLGLPAYSCQERSRSHGDPLRFRCALRLEGAMAGGRPLDTEGWGGSRREAEQQAACAALEVLGLSRSGKGSGARH